VASRGRLRYDEGRDGPWLAVPEEIMAERPRFGIVDVLWLVLILAAAAGARTAYLLTSADGGREAGPLAVQSPSPVLTTLPADAPPMLGKPAPTELDALVSNLKEHRWFGSMAPFSPGEERTAHVAPGYPWLLALLARVAGNDLEFVVRWAQCILGTLTAGLYFLFAYRAFGSRPVAILAGLLCALHPFWIIDTAALGDAVVTSFLLALVLYLGVLASQTGGAFASLLYGVSLAGLALMRAALLPFAFVSIMWFLLRCRRIERGWLCALLAFLGFANGLGPWTLRNLHAYGKPVPVVDSTYVDLWMGNNRYSTGGPQSEETMLRALAERRGSDPETVRKELAAQPQPERYRTLARDLVGEVMDHPGRFLENRLQAAVAFLLGERWLEAHPGEPRTLALVRSGEHEMWLVGLRLALVLMFALVFLGWRWTYPWRHDAMPSSLAILWVPLPYILGHAGYLHGPRLPLDGVLLTYGALALVCLWPGTGVSLFRPATEQKPEPPR
jgi:Dolichyl-phosphate-mannose-protein mannosyltransferase